jgi:hypothetical protein
MGLEGPSPFFVVVLSNTEQGISHVLLDLDTPSQDRPVPPPGAWVLVEKASMKPLLAIEVHEGEQANYKIRAVGTIPLGGGVAREIKTYGLEKTRPDGSTQGAWVMPNGMIVPGDDVYEIGDRMNKGRF